LWQYLFGVCGEPWPMHGVIMSLKLTFTLHSSSF